MKEIKPVEITLETEEDVQRFCDLFDDTKVPPEILRARELVKNHKPAPLRVRNKSLKRK
ncbi:hypothetical protein BSP10_118 [Bacillus phage BSP10]|nr:hypothetical protein BSP10_118 [Bacillus phage BSP10]QRI44647.1 hypothetical protein BSTP3_101 [Bacillus phage BSTP3]